MQRALAVGSFDLSKQAAERGGEPRRPFDDVGFGSGVVLPNRQEFVHQIQTSQNGDLKGGSTGAELALDLVHALIDQLGNVLHVIGGMVLVDAQSVGLAEYISYGVRRDSKPP